MSYLSFFKNLSKTLILILFGLTSLNGQMPGGVGEYKYWFLASEHSDSLLSETENSINFYSAFSVNYQKKLEDLNSLQKNEDATVFVVLKPAFLQEEYQLLDINFIDRRISIQSDRIKSKEELKIKNFNSPKPYFFSYLESYEEDKNINDSVQLDNISQNNYPSKFEGDVAEVIYYPKLLSKLERRKVETYLSLKYGISLPLKSDYINSKNDTIWKSDESRIFLNRVSGIGKDFAGNFNHKQSANVDDNQFLIIGLGDKIEPKNELNKKSINDSNYVIWADDFGDLSFLQEKQTPEVSVFNRTWKTKLIGEGVLSQNYIFSFDSKLMEGQNQEEKKLMQEDQKSDSEKPKIKYWLVFAPDTSDEINIHSAEFIQSVEIPEQGGRIEFSDIPFKNQTESFLFTLVKAPELFALVETTENNCQSDAHLNIIGGVGPYKIDFYSDENQKFPIIEKGVNEFEIVNLTGGHYICKITDAYNQSTEQTIYINSDPQGEFKLENIFLKEGENLTLDLKDLQNNTISEIIWLKDAQEIGWGEKHTIREEGSYSINYLTEKGCAQTTPFVVTKIPAVEWSGVYPNPVRTNEPFFVKLENLSLSKVRITITDFSGRVIKSKLLKEGSEIYSDTFFHQGTYFITAESQSEKFQYTLIVK
jgi:hypothetical protein